MMIDKIQILECKIILQSVYIVVCNIIIKVVLCTLNIKLELISEYNSHYKRILYELRFKSINIISYIPFLLSFFVSIHNLHDTANFDPGDGLYSIFRGTTVWQDIH